MSGQRVAAVGIILLLAVGATAIVPRILLDDSEVAATQSTEYAPGDPRFTLDAPIPPLAVVAEADAEAPAPGEPNPEESEAPEETYKPGAPGSPAPRPGGGGSEGGNGDSGGSGGGSGGTPQPPYELPEDIDEEAEPIPEMDITCEGKETLDADGNRFPLTNHGRGDSTMVDLIWGAMKGGERFTVMWNSPRVSNSTLNYRIFDGVPHDPGAPYSAVEDSRESKAHYFILQFPQATAGAWMEFYVEDTDTAGAITRTSDTHRLVLCNANNAWSEHAQKYIINLSVTSFDEAGPEGGTLDHASIEYGMNVFANKIWDGTDGWVAIGSVMIIYNEPKLKQGGHWPVPTCGNTDPSCGIDTVFTYAENPQAAGSTNLMGIRAASSQIAMNQAYEAHSPPGNPQFGSLAWEVGSVMAHEFGHYAFGMPDQYESAEGAPAAPLSDCWSDEDSAGISIMSGSREATEFDDDVQNRCPNELGASGRGRVSGEYMPSWLSLITNYPEIPYRAGAYDPGPAGYGPAYALGVIDRQAVV